MSSFISFTIQTCLVKVNQVGYQLDMYTVQCGSQVKFSVNCRLMSIFPIFIPKSVFGDWTFEKAPLRDKISNKTSNSNFNLFSIY